MRIVVRKVNPLLGIPAYRQVRADLEQAIIIGRFPIGAQLDHRRLAIEYEVDPAVIANAIDTLQTDGYVADGRVISATIG